MYQGYDAVKFKKDGKVLTVMISNPGSRNAVNATLHDEMPRAFAEIAKDRDTRVVVLTGDPDGGAFCAGGDINWIDGIQGSSVKFDTVMQEGRDVLRNICETPQPVIAMINGHAMGLGATIALHCDISYMDEKAKIADPHVAIGVVAGDGGAVIWPLLIGPNRAKEFLMTGDALTGKQAADIGLVNHALPADQLAEATYAMANRLADGPRLAVEWTKRSVNLFVNQVSNTVLTASLALEGMTFNTPDHREAVRAFLNKQKPEFGKDEG